MLRGAVRAAFRAASVAHFFYIEAERIIVNGKVDQRRLTMLANAATNRNLEMLSNAAATTAATKTTVADDKDSRKEDSATDSDSPCPKKQDAAQQIVRDPVTGLRWPSTPHTRKDASLTKSAGASLKYQDEAPKTSMDPLTDALWPSSAPASKDASSTESAGPSVSPPPRKEESVTKPTGPSPTYRGEVQAYDLGTDPIPGEVWACPPKSSEESDDGFPGTPPPEDSTPESDAPPAEVLSKRPDLADEDNSSYSTEDDAELGYDPAVAEDAKRRASQTSAAGGKP